MGRYLIVANQTLGGAELDGAVRERIERGEAEFYVVVPMTLPQHESPGWTGGFDLGPSVAQPWAGGIDEGMAPEQAARQMEEDSRRRQVLHDDARRRAEHRLEQMIEKVRSAGGDVEGKVGDPDPAAAVREVLQGRSFDEVIISTLPAGISRWLRMDLSSRVSRMTDAPVTTVVAEA